MRRVLMLAAVICTACADDGDHVKPLKQALAEIRTEHASLCDAWDECYPTLQTESECRVPTDSGSSGVERDWPPKPEDECWSPLYDKSPQTVIDYFECLSATRHAARDCFASCPDSEELEPCMRDLNRAEEECARGLVPGVAEDDVREMEACQARND